mgnify:CR=1 FL=1
MLSVKNETMCRRRVYYLLAANAAEALLHVHAKLYTTIHESMKRPKELPTPSIISSFCA